MVARGNTPGPLFSGGWEIFHQGKVCSRSVVSITESRVPSREIYGAQLQNWGGHSSMEMRYPRLLNKNARSLGEFSLHKLYQNTTRDIIRSVKKTTKEQELTNKYV